LTLPIILTVVRRAGLARRYSLLILWSLLVAAVLLALWWRLDQSLPAAPVFPARFQTFVTIFLGIFIEAVPFLTAGSIVSGLIEVFVDKRIIERIIPRHPVAGALTGSLLGFVFPVCECGVVPVTRRLYQKGMSLSVGIAFLLAAPVINPIVLAGTYAAFGWGPMVAWRFALTIVIAFIIGLVFYVAQPEEVLLPESSDAIRRSFRLAPPLAPGAETSSRLWRALGIAGDDFMDMARYLIVGSMLAAGMQTLVPQSTLLAIGSDAFLSVVAMMALAFVLSICSTVDSFVALSFVATFSPAAILSFLVFGPMVDIKSALMFLSVFRRRTVLYLILLPLILTLVVTVYMNLNMPW
jgi:uncharacterized protein